MQPLRSWYCRSCGSFGSVLSTLDKDLHAAMKAHVLRTGDEPALMIDVNATAQVIIEANLGELRKLAGMWP